MMGNFWDQPGIVPEPDLCFCLFQSFLEFVNNEYGVASYILLCASPYSQALKS